MIRAILPRRFRCPLAGASQKVARRISGRGAACCAPVRVVDFSGSAHGGLYCHPDRPYCHPDRSGGISPNISIRPPLQAICDPLHHPSENTERF